MPDRPRTFLCSDELWAAAERLAWQIQRPVDDVVTEALVRYVRASAMPTQAPSGYGPPAPPTPQYGPPGAPPLPPTLVTPQVPGRPPFPPPPPPPPRPPSASPPAMPRMPPPMPQQPQQQQMAPPQGGGYPPPGYGYRPPPEPAPPPPPSIDDGPPTYPLYMYFENQRVQIMQPRFVIGRSRSASDFAINDSNVSRQHAAVEWLRGHYHIVDLGSTNGIQFNGRRVERKVIYDNDVIIVAGHQLRFARQ